MSAAFEFKHRVEFLPDKADDLLRLLPAAQGVFALRGADPAAEPYLTRAADLRRRARRLLAPPEALDDNGNPVLSKRLNLRSRVRWIEWTATGSEFESALVLYNATRSAFGAEAARKRLRLHPPYMLRVTMSHDHPRVYVTNRLSAKSLAESFGPFPSRAAADRYCDAVLDLFQLRRCYEDLTPYPDHPGCAYGEMKKCIAPCKQACTPEQYAAESQRIFAFFRTRGQSLLDEVATQREAASEAMDFEGAATLHKHWEKVRAASLLADELVRPISALRAVILQEAVPIDPADNSGAPFIAGLQPTMSGNDAQATAIFLLQHGHIAGPKRLSTLGVRAVREQTAVGSSLFAQPLMLAPVPLEGEMALQPTSESPDVGHPTGAGAPGLASETWASTKVSTPQTPEDRARLSLSHLESQTTADPELPNLCDALSLFRRWYYRPEKQRQGEVFLPNPDGTWPIRRILNGAARVVLGPPTVAPDVDREAAKILKTKKLHEGREGIERDVPVLPKRTRSRKAVTPSDISS